MIDNQMEENLERNEEGKKELRIKKSTLWIFFSVLVIVVLIILWNPFGKPGGTTIDASQFLNNPALYPSLGPGNAKDTVIEFYDFQCPICGLASGLPGWSPSYSSNAGYNVSGQVEQAAEAGKIRFISVPMSFLDSRSDATQKGSTWAAEAALCANDQGKFWEMHDIIYSNQVTPAQEGVQFTKQQLTSMAAQIQGMNQSQFSDCLQTDKYLIKTQEITNAAFNAGVTGTPTFVINGKVLSDWTTAASILK